MASKVAPKDKAILYLYDEKVKVQWHTLEPPSCYIEVQGSAVKPYIVRFEHNEWTCDCPSQLECAHIIASKLVSPLRAVERPQIEGADITLDEFLKALDE